MLIEYDENDEPHEQCSSDIDGVIDFTKSTDILNGKPYELMQAIPGVRVSRNSPPYIPPPPGFPQNLNWRIKRYFDEGFYTSSHSKIRFPD